jgi:predicted metal-binding membrane protein
MVLSAAMYQFTSWIETPSLDLPRKRGRTAILGASIRMRRGDTWLQLGLRCRAYCVGLMAVLLVVGVTDMRAMASILDTDDGQQRV